MALSKTLKKLIATGGLVASMTTTPVFSQSTDQKIDTTRQEAVDMLQTQGLAKQLKKFLRVDGKEIADLKIISLSDSTDTKKGVISFTLQPLGQVLELPFVYGYDQTSNAYRPVFQKLQLLETSEGAYEVLYKDHDGIIDISIKKMDTQILERLKKLTQTTLQMDSSAIEQLQEFQDINKHSLKQFFEQLQVSSLLEKDSLRYFRRMFSHRNGSYQEHGKIWYTSKGDLDDQDSLEIEVMGQTIVAGIEDSLGSGHHHHVFIIDFNESDLEGLEAKIIAQQKMIVGVINHAVSWNHAEEVMPALKKNKLDENYESTVDPTFLSFPQSDGSYTFVLNPTKKLSLNFLVEDNRMSFKTLAWKVQELMLESQIKKDDKEEKIYYLVNLSQWQEQQLSFKTITQAEYLKSYHRPHFVSPKNEKLPPVLKDVENLSRVADTYDKTTKKYALYNSDGLIVNLPLDKKINNNDLQWDLLEEKMNTTYDMKALFSPHLFKEGYVQSIGLSNQDLLGEQWVFATLIKKDVYKPKHHRNAFVYQKDSTGLTPSYYTFEQSQAGKDIVVEKDHELYGAANRITQKVLLDLTVLWIFDHGIQLFDAKLGKNLSQSQGLKLLPIATEEKLKFLNSVESQRTFSQLLQKEGKTLYILQYEIDKDGILMLKDVKWSSGKKSGRWEVMFGTQKYTLSFDDNEFSYKTDHLFYGSQSSKYLKLVCEDIPEKIK